MPEISSEQPDELASSRQQALGAAAPDAIEPLDQGRLNALTDTVLRALDALSGSQVEPPQIERVTEPQQRIPTDLYSAIQATAAFLESAGERVPAAKSHVVDPQVADSNDGVAELMSAFDALASDRELAAALGRAPAGQPEPPAQPEAAPPASDRLQALTV